MTFVRARQDLQDFTLFLVLNILGIYTSFQPPYT